MTEPKQEQIKYVVDVAAGATTVSALMDLVPSATAILSMMWVCIRIWETETVKNLTGR